MALRLTQPEEQLRVETRVAAVGCDQLQRLLEPADGLVRGELLERAAAGATGESIALAASSGTRAADQ